jgi:O-antigen/teichoic acid export membrane protein
MAGASSVTRTTLVTFAVNVLTAAFALASVLVISRTLGPEGRGEVVFLMTMASLTSRLAMLGIQEANVNFGAAEPETRGRLATNSLLLSLVFGWIAAGIVLVLASAFPAFGGHSDETLRWIALGSMPILVFQAAMLRLVHADSRFAFANLATFVPPALNLALVIGLALADRLTVGATIVSWVVSWAASVVMLVVFTQMRIAPFARADAPLARRMVSFGSKSHLGRVMSMGNYRLDQWFVGSLAGSRELGLYSVAVSWFEALTYLPTALAIVLRPSMVRADPEEAAKRTAAALRVTLIVTALFVVLMVVAAPVLCVTVFGEEFRGAVDDLRILAFGAFGIMSLRIVGSTLTAQRRPLLETAAIAVGLVFTITLDIALIPGHGGAGAALASIVAYSAAGIAIVAIFARSLHARWSDLRPRRDDFELLLRRVRQLGSRA